MAVPAGEISKAAEIHELILRKEKIGMKTNGMQRKSWEIIKETDDFVAINKPAGLLSIPDREADEISLKKILKDIYGEIYTVHRLDRETSGVIIFAKNESAHKYLSKLFEERTVEKYYLGLVNGTPAEKENTIDAPIAQHSVKSTKMIIHKRGKPSVTDYKVLEQFRKFSYLQFRIHTGRTHQIRVHMQHIGHPIVCDPVYGDGAPVLLSSLKKNYHLSKSEEEERPILSRLALHSYRIVFDDHNISAEPPKDIRALLQQLRKLN